MIKFLNQYIPLRKPFFFLFESLFIISMIVLAIVLRFSDNFVNYLGHGMVFKSLIITISIQLSLYYFDMYELKIFQNNFELIIRLLQSIGIASIVLAILYYVFPDLIIGRGVFFISLVLITTLLILWRLLYNYINKSERLDQRVMILGTGLFADNIIKKINEKIDSGFKIAGLIIKDKKELSSKKVDDLIISNYSDMLETCIKEKIDRIIVALDDKRGAFPIYELLACKMKGIIIQEGTKFYNKFTGQLPIESLKPSFIIFSEGFHQSKITLWMKNTIDFVLALTGLIFASLFILIVPVLIKLESRGSIFYKQERMGKNGKVFKLIKFRTMVENAEANGPVWAQKNDLRVTRIGRFLRKSRIDEIPQIINVLKGDMSFVGPRPERPFFIEQLNRQIPFYNQRLIVKPGITGWAQIKYSYGASKEDAMEKLKYDLYYIDNLSILFDLVIIFETVKVVLFGKGAQ